MNPARSLAPAVVGGHTEYLWAYLMAPTIGALSAVALAKVVEQPAGAELKPEG